MKETFHTKAQRDKREGKGRYDLLSPFFLKRVALVLEQGAKHYGERNWEKGIPICRTIDSTIRHMQQFLMRMNDEDHLANCACNIMFLSHTIQMINRGVLSRELDDRPEWTNERRTRRTRKITRKS